MSGTAAYLQTFGMGSFVSLFYSDVANTGVTILRSFQQYNRSTG